MKSIYQTMLAAAAVGMLAGCGTEVTSTKSVDQRLNDFYANTGGTMNEPLPKYDIVTGERVYPNAFLKLKNGVPRSPLLRNAQMKGTAEFRNRHCRQLKRRFSGLDCREWETWSEVKPHDRVEELVEGWVEKVERRMDKLLPEGRVEITPWSDDYWQIRYGATSYRYSAKDYFSSYREAVAAYAQPAQWDALIRGTDPKEMMAAILKWSPAEKYDLSVGDIDFSMTNEQKREGKQFERDGDVESWMGLCHGWAAAAMMVPGPLKPVSLMGANELSVRWYPHDIRAMVTLAWANGEVRSNYVGGRCNTREPELYPNDRIKNEECFDNNPATFHLALANQIGREKAAFVMDTAFDYEVWNQPVQSYRFTYFNPLAPDKRSQNWKEVAVPYDAKFKEKDRFQNPPTRGNRAKLIVGVLAEIAYIAEVSPNHGDKAREPRLVGVTYDYDLELSEENGQVVPTGGEWHTNAHPDFLWVPRKGKKAAHSLDRVTLEFTGREVPDAQVTKVAERASRDGYPLCQVLSVLVNGSSDGRIQYDCK